MQRMRTAGVVALIGLVALAGCSGLTGGDGTPSATDGGPNQASVDTDALLATHTSVLENASNFTTNATIEINGSSFLSGTQNVKYLVGGSGDRALLRQQSPRSTVVQYTAENATYLRQSRQGNVSYRMATAPYGDSRRSLGPVNTSQARQLAGLAGVLGNVSYQQAGSGTVDGAAVTRYEANGTGAIDLGNASGTVTAFNSSLSVAEDSGVIRSLTLTVAIRNQGQTQRQDIAVTVSGVGSTTVPEPDWLDQARSQNETAA